VLSKLFNPVSALLADQLADQLADLLADLLADHMEGQLVVPQLEVLVVHLAAVPRVDWDSSLLAD
jgi:hypothetical protein